MGKTYQVWGADGALGIEHADKEEAIRLAQETGSCVMEYIDGHDGRVVWPEEEPV